MEWFGLESFLAAQAKQKNLHHCKFSPLPYYLGKGENWPICWLVYRANKGTNGENVDKNFHTWHLNLPHYLGLTHPLICIIPIQIVRDVYV
jgi:hypothetical protein